MTTTDPAFEDWLASARNVNLVTVVEQRGIRLTRGTERTGACPIERTGKDRFAVNVRKKLWSCRGCGTGGDVIRLVEMMDGVDFVAACEILTGEPPPRSRSMTAQERADIARRHAEREAEAAAARQKRDEEAKRYREAERERLYGIWRQGQPVPGSPAGEYLAGRGIPVLPASAALRYHHAMRYYVDGGPQGWQVLHTGPALLAAITGDDGRFRGLHTTWIEKHGAGWRKCSFGQGDLPAKKVRGSKSGHRIVLRGSNAPRRLYVGEGIETVLSVFTALTRAGRLEDGDIFFSAIDLGNLAGRALESVEHPTERRVDAKGRHRAARVPGPEPDMSSPAFTVPPGVEEVILLGDADSEAFMTQMALHRAAARIRQASPHVQRVRCAMAEGGSDYNDMLLGAA